MEELKSNYKERMNSFIQKYKELNVQITAIQNTMKGLQEGADMILKELESVRSQEKEWLKTSSMELGISVKEFINKYIIIK